MAQSAIDLSLDRASDIPLGTQLAWKLRGAIASGRLAPGDRLPGVRELAAEAGVNVNTVRSVYARLADQGVIVSRHGRGTFVGQTAARDDLVRLAERAAREARESGIDPRELAALLYVQDRGRTPSLHRRDDAASLRRELRESIERLEREQAELEVELAVTAEAPPRLPEPDKPSPARKRIGARLLSAEELEAARDALADQVADLRRQLTAARERDTVAQRSPRSVATGSPQTATGGGSWTLRWKA
jgi:GntR family transcriptional regulator